MIRFALLGLASGAIYAVLAQGLVLVYRGSGLLNFAQGAMAMVGAYAYWELTARHGLPRGIGLAGAVALCALLGAAIHLLILRPMHRSSPLARVIATLGVLISLQSAAFIRYGHDPRQVASLLPTRTVHVFSNRLPIGEDRIIILLIGVLLTLVLTLVYRRSAFGRVTTAVAESHVVAASLGHSPDRTAAANWALGSGLAGMAGVLIAPIIFLEPSSLVLLVLPAMAAALLGQFASFPLTLGMALLLGVAQSEITRYVSAPGWATAAPFIAVIALLVVRGQAIPLRSFMSDRLPVVSDGRIRPVPAVIAAGLAVAAVIAGDPTWALSLTTTFAVAIVCLSVVVVTGYAGQLSLAQYVLAGVGALIAAKLTAHMSFPLAFVLAVIATGAVGGVVGAPALRTRGIALAIVTLGLGASVYAVVLSNQDYTGGVSGIIVPIPHLLGWDIDPFAHGTRYAFVVLAVLIALCLAVMNLRRGPVGRRLLAVRSNERAAAGLGVNVAATKSYAFVLSAMIAAAGGILLAFTQASVIVAGYDVFSSIFVAAVTVAGAVGAVSGALIGSVLVPGGALSQLLNGLSRVNDYLPLAGGLVLLVVLRADPDGLLHAVCRGVAALPMPPGPWRRGAATPPPADAGVPDRPPERVAERALHVDGVSVAYGGVRAVTDVSLVVEPGQVHGIIGPNGAGKTTLIDAITGFAATTGGTIRVGDADVSRWTPRRRAQAGLSRSFQSLELFEDLTVAENLAVACERPGAWRYVADLVLPRGVRPSAAAVEVMHQFGLQDVADRKPGEISFGRRKEVAIARAIAAAPSILLLDEPAAGLHDHEVDELAELVRRLAHERGIAVLLVEHKVDMIMAISDRITVLVGGAVLTSGTPDAVRADPAVLEAYLGRTPPASVGARTKS